MGCASENREEGRSHCTRWHGAGRLAWARVCVAGPNSTRWLYTLPAEKITRAPSFFIFFSFFFSFQSIFTIIVIFCLTQHQKSTCGGVEEESVCGVEVER